MGCSIFQVCFAEQMEGSVSVLRRLDEESHEAGEEFVWLVFYFFICCVALKVVLVGVDYLLRHLRGKRGSANRADGLMMAGKLPWVVRGTFGITVFTLIVVPLTVICVCFVLGPVVAVLEGWSVVIGIEYMMGNLLGLANPLT